MYLCIINFALRENAQIGQYVCAHVFSISSLEMVLVIESPCFRDIHLLNTSVTFIYPVCVCVWGSHTV